MRKRVTCPFCQGDGCCFCDHEGNIYVGPNELIKSEAGLNSVGVTYLKEADQEAGGGLEPWPEMWAHFLDETQTPEARNRQLNERLLAKLRSDKPLM